MGFTNERKRIAEAEATAAKLKELTVKVVAKGGNGGRLFGAVTSKEIADALQAQHGIAIPKTKIVQDEPIKAFGGYLPSSLLQQNSIRIPDRQKPRTKVLPANRFRGRSNDTGKPIDTDRRTHMNVTAVWVARHCIRRWASSIWRILHWKRMR